MAGLGETHAPRGADEERGAEVALEGLEAGREGRLTEKEPLGGAAHASLAGNRYEGLHLGQKHEGIDPYSIAAIKRNDRIDSPAALYDRRMG